MKMECNPRTKVGREIENPVEMNGYYQNIQGIETSAFRTFVSCSKMTDTRPIQCRGTETVGVDVEVHKDMVSALLDCRPVSDRQIPIHLRAESLEIKNKHVQEKTSNLDDREKSSNYTSNSCLSYIKHKRWAFGLYMSNKILTQRGLRRLTENLSWRIFLLRGSGKTDIFVISANLPDDHYGTAPKKNNKLIYILVWKTILGGKKSTVTRDFLHLQD